MNPVSVHLDCVKIRAIKLELIVLAFVAVVMV